ncbi:MULTISPECIES: hypothetical protein [Sporosarcina]|uniref:ABC transporter permease n=1 Tax=Sporosarcina contaminans TaxID=633403 RepID=A0ABW3TWE4_9BACL
MKQWNGLLWKEWVQWRLSLLIIIVFMAAALIGLPSFARLLAVEEVSVFEITMVICFIAAGACILVPVIHFLMMFNKDMKSPDLWLHSTASTTELVGAKMLMATLSGAACIAVPVIVVAFRYVTAVSHPVDMFDELLFFGTLLIAIIFLSSIQFMVYGFFFIVIEQVLKPFVKGFSLVITLLLFIVSVRVYGEITSSPFFERFVRFGKIDLMKLKNPHIELEYGYFALNGTVLYVGEVMFAMLLTIGLFLAGIALFEKRVRL